MNAVRAIIAAIMAGILSSVAYGQSYPDKPVRLVVTYPPSGVTDLLARTIAPKMSEILKQPVVVENRAGAGGTIGAQAVAQSAADGYTLMLLVGGHTLAPNLYAKLPYDVVKDFTPISTLARTTYVLVTNPEVPARTVDELISLAKAKPGQLNYGTAGIGNLAHLSAEMFNNMAGIKTTHVAYKGDSPAVTDLIGGQVQFGFFATSVVMPHVKSGKLRALAVTTPQRNPSMPDLPAMSEVPVLKGYDISSWTGLAAPAGTPKEIVAQLNKTVRAVLAQDDVRERLAGMGLDVTANSPEEFAAFTRAEVEKFAKLAAAAGVKPE